jgi:protein-tyrosine phosphatase
MIDLHSHLLPNLDDGSRSLEQSVRALTRFAEVGVSHVVLTPHLRASEIDQFGEDTIAQRDETLEILAPEAPNPPSLYLGFEIMVDLPMPPGVEVLPGGVSHGGGTGLCDARAGTDQ